ncbi:MAG: Na+/H+ antiporter subunit E [Myxococcales bacterium]|nr:Na+/H+ antiporter subunit E [Myxococcales bacterium]MCB9755569.1 Na+/H+ antiporter subunit E [Myxococcales bacterium]
MFARLLTLIIVQAVFWALLSGQFHNPVLIGTGIVCIVGVALLGLKMQILDEDTAPNVTWFRLLIYVPYLTKEILLANWDVLKRIWDPVMDIDPRMIRVPYKTRTAFGTTTYANSITLTPGTVTVEVDTAGKQMQIHALTQEAEDGLLTGEMERQVMKLEG